MAPAVVDPRRQAAPGPLWSRTQWRRSQRKQSGASLGCKLAWEMAANGDLRRQLVALAVAIATGEGDELAQRLEFFFTVFGCWSAGGRLAASLSSAP